MVSQTSISTTCTKKCPNANHQLTKLASNFQPGPKDVLCSRGKAAYDHNTYFREIVREYLPSYSQASTKAEKSDILSAIVDTIRTRNPSGGFVRKVNGEWFTVGDCTAREKIGGCFREMLADLYKSSSKSKKRRRQENEFRVESPMPVDVPPMPDIKLVLPKRQRLEPSIEVDPEDRFESMFQDITSRIQELSEKVSMDCSFFPPKPVTLPAPPKFPASPVPGVDRRTSYESVHSFDFDRQCSDFLVLPKLVFTESCSSLW